MSELIGTPVEHGGQIGYVARVLTPELAGAVLTAGGLQAIRADYEIVWPDHVSRLSDGVAAPMIARAKGVARISADELATLRAKAEAAQAAARQRLADEREQAKKNESEFRAIARQKTPAWAKAVITAEYRVDQSDSMSDYYGHATRRVVILCFSTHTRDLFPEMRKAAALFKETADLATAPESAEHREKYSMGGGFYLKNGWRDSTGWAVKKWTLHRGADSVPVGEWLEVEKPKAAEKPAATPAATLSGVRIEEHEHTKHGFQMWIVCGFERVERAEFEAMRDAAKAAGGWYSRAWGKSPAGFAFKDKAKAEAFAEARGQVVAPQMPPGIIAAGLAEAMGGPLATEAVAADRAGAAAPVSRGDTLRALAYRMDSEIKAKFADRLSNTPKRQREAQSARLDGQHLQRTQNALRALADLHDSGQVPAALQSVKTKAAVHTLTRSIIQRSGGYYDAGVDTGQPAETSAAAVALWALLKPRSEEEKAAEELKRKIDALQFAKIPGYFPTPREIVAKMIRLADLPAGPCTVLEPEAGSGGILDALREEAPNATPVAFEVWGSLREILKAKGYTLAGGNFLEAQPAAHPVDFVLMNPPFESGQDIEHVRHAFEFLKPGGRLVAIMSPGPFYRSDAKARAFREWFDSRVTHSEEIPAGAFKESGTGVATVLIVLDK